MELPQLETLFSKLPLPEGSVVVLTDAASFQPDADDAPRFHGNAVIERGPWTVSVAIPRTEVLRRLAPLWQRNLVLLAIAVAAVLALAFWVSWQTAIELRHLQLVAQHIASGDFSPPVQRAVPNREMEQLQSSFVTMAARLRDARDTVERQIAQERKMLETVQSLQRQVVRQERHAAVGLLVSGVAHELNNPLQAILGGVELIERMSGVPESVIESIAFVKAQSDRANDIIRSLARFSSHRTAAPAAVDLLDVIGEVLQLRKPELDRLGIAVDVESSAARRGVCGVRRTRTGGDEFRRQREASHRIDRPQPRTYSHPSARHASRDPARGLGRRP